MLIAVPALASAGSVAKAFAAATPADLTLAAIGRVPTVCGLYDVCVVANRDSNVTSVNATLLAPSMSAGVSRQVAVAAEAATLSLPDSELRAAYLDLLVVAQARQQRKVFEKDATASMGAGVGAQKRLSPVTFTLRQHQGSRMGAGFGGAQKRLSPVTFTLREHQGSRILTLPESVQIARLVPSLRDSLRTA